MHSRNRWMEIFQETRWNPWRTEELGAEKDGTYRVMREWTRAEPDFRPMTNRQVGAMMGAMKRRHKAQQKTDDTRWEQNRQRYDPEREKARYALLEQESIHVGQVAELEAYRSGERYPRMDPDHRAQKMAKLEEKLQRCDAEIARLSVVVGDREDVVDERGLLPGDRRIGNFVMYRMAREDKVEELQQLTSELRERIGSTKDRSEKSKLRTELQFKDRHLQALLHVPILTAEDMCADCATPQYQHASGGGPYESRPCGHWPIFATHMDRLYEYLRSTLDNAKPVAPAPPQPLATLPGSLPIAEVIDQLSELQKTYPGAIVKQGRGKQWELWPAE